ncbi:MAG: CPBP family intramembrane glutamic endopeptidase [Candidatus Bruticola sp.]
MFSNKYQQKLFFCLTAVQLAVLTTALILSYYFDIELINKFNSISGWIGGAVGGFCFAGSSKWILNKLAEHKNQTVQNYLYLTGSIFQHFTIAQCLFLAILSGFCEELLFRGTLLPLMGLLLSSTIFGLLHYASKQMWFWPFLAFCLGIFLGAVSLQTNSLSFAVSFHFMNNFCSFHHIKKWASLNLRTPLTENSDYLTSTPPGSL